MFDLVLLLVEFTFSEEVIDGFVILLCAMRLPYLCTKGTRTISRNWPSRVYSQPLLFNSSVTWKTWSTARGIMPTVSLVFQDDIIARFDGNILRGHSLPLLPS